MSAPTYRISALPSTTTAAALASALSLLCGADHTPHVDVLAPSPLTAKQLVALVRFTPTPPPLLASLHPRSDSPVPSLTLDTSLGVLTIDTTFYGLTPLTAQPASATALDLIVLHGLDGHPFGSFRSKTAPYVHWLRDYLPQDLPRVRVLTFGYNAKLRSTGTHALLDYTRSLLETLRLLPRSRPLVLLGHSFGGLVAAHALVAAEEADEDPATHAIFLATRGVLFFGTPHHGLLVDDILTMVSPRTQPEREQLVHGIETGADVLRESLVKFGYFADSFVLVASFYETLKTRRLVRDADGTWARKGEEVVVLTRDAATLGLPWVPERRVPVEADHSSIVKFESAADPTYRVVVGMLGGVLDVVEGEHGDSVADLRSAFSRASASWISDDHQLRLAAERGDAHTVALFVKAGVDVVRADAKGVTPLHLATASGSEELVLLLLRLDPSGRARRDAKGRTPAMWAKDGRLVQILSA